MFARGEASEGGNFTGKVWKSELLEKCDVFNCAIGNVTFEAGCRNSWHKHSAGQILLCTEGEGYYCERGGNIRKLFPGDVVKIAPGVEHWHGASPTSNFAHVFVTPNLDQGGIEWLEPVSDADYTKGL